MPTLFTINPDGGGPDFGQVASFAFTSPFDFLRASNSQSSWSQRFDTGTADTGIEVIVQRDPGLTAGSVTIKWNGVVLQATQFADVKNPSPSQYTLTVSDTGLVTYTHNFGGPPVTAQIPNNEWQTTDNSDWVYTGASTGGGVTNNGTPTTSQTSPPPPCLTSGTMVRCAIGNIAVENLRVGDRVWTLDNGYQPLRWIGHRKIRSEQLALNPKWRPYRIAAGSLGPNMPERNLTVSPQHRIYLESRIVQRMFGTNAVLIAAAKLTDIAGITQIQSCDDVCYWHLLFDAHEVICADGALTESLFLGSEFPRTMSPTSQKEIVMLRPDILDADFQPQSARPIVAKGVQIRQMIARHLKNRVHYVNSRASNLT